MGNKNLPKNANFAKSDLTERVTSDAMGDAEADFELTPNEERENGRLKEEEREDGRLKEEREDGRLAFLKDEMEAFQCTKKLLLEKYNLDEKKVSARELMVTVINCKLRPDQAASKYVKWLESMIPFGNRYSLTPLVTQ